MSVASAAGGAVSRVLARVDGWQARHAVIGVPVAVVKKFSEDDAAGLGVQVAYWAFFSVFALMLAFVSILGFVFQNNPGFQKQVVDSTLRLMPVIGPQISGNVGSLTGSAAALAIGLVGALWTGLGVTLALGTAFDQIWAVPRPDRLGYVGSRLRGLLLLVVVGVASVAATAGAGLAAAGAIAPVLPTILGIMLAGGIDLAVFVTSFRLLTAAPVTTRQVLPGALLASACWLALQTLGGVYISRALVGSSQTYGGFAAVVGLLSWLLIAAEITLMAAELNVVLARRLWPRALAGELLPADEAALRAAVQAEQRDRRQQITVTMSAPEAPSPDAASADRARPEAVSPDAASADSARPDREARE